MMMSEDEALISTVELYVENHKRLVDRYHSLEHEIKLLQAENEKLRAENARLHFVFIAGKGRKEI